MIDLNDRLDPRTFELLYSPPLSGSHSISHRQQLAISLFVMSATEFDIFRRYLTLKQFTEARPHGSKLFNSVAPPIPDARDSDLNFCRARIQLDKEKRMYTYKQKKLQDDLANEVDEVSRISALSTSTATSRRTLCRYLKG